MTGNRVEELEAKVRELEASISGLTDELVETKERLRLIEDHVDLDDVLDADERRAARKQRSKDAEQAAQANAEAEAAASADEAKGESEEEESESSADDIIVA
ncbi:DUF7518 family protein [Natronomonas sp. EA1]|uniref:DUF7518 family protein n=1 Tax=Natronomonas sp. EA1 TaxID=3421655 RepID=UPI003EB98414